MPQKGITINNTAPSLLSIEHLTNTFSQRVHRYTQVHQISCNQSYKLVPLPNAGGLNNNSPQAMVNHSTFPQSVHESIQDKKAENLIDRQFWGEDRPASIKTPLSKCCDTSRHLTSVPDLVHQYCENLLKMVTNLILNPLYCSVF